MCWLLEWMSKINCMYSRDRRSKCKYKIFYIDSSKICFQNCINIQKNFLLGKKFSRRLGFLLCDVKHNFADLVINAVA